MQCFIGNSVNINPCFLIWSRIFLMLGWTVKAGTSLVLILRRIRGDTMWQRSYKWTVSLWECALILRGLKKNNSNCSWQTSLLLYLMQHSILNFAPQLYTLFSTLLLVNADFCCICLLVSGRLSGAKKKNLYSSYAIVLSVSPDLLSDTLMTQIRL